MKYQITNQRDLRRAFWQEHTPSPQGLNVTRKRITHYSGKGKMHKHRHASHLVRLARLHVER